MKKVLLTFGIFLLTVGSAFGYSMPRWGVTNIDVYLPESQYSGMVRNAFSTWSQATNGRVKFRFNSTRFYSKNAPIKIQFIDEKAPYFIVVSKRYETTGYFMDMEDGYINRANLKIYTINRLGETISDEELLRNLHPEIGYILGLEKIYGPCPNSSIMCYENYGKFSTLQPVDRKEINEKYTRSGDDIKKNNPNTSK